MGGDSRRVCMGGCGCVWLCSCPPAKGPSSSPIPLGVCRGPGRGAALQPLLLPAPSRHPWGAHFGLLGTRDSLTHAELLRTSAPATPAARVRTLATSIGLRLDSCAHPRGLPTQVALAFPSSPVDESDSRTCSAALTCTRKKPPTESRPWPPPTEWMFVQAHERADARAQTHAYAKSRRLQEERDFVLPVGMTGPGHREGAQG